MKPTYLSEATSRARALLEQITPDKWFAFDWPGQGWTVCWRQDAPICHMRWTDGLRPAVEVRIQAEAEFIAAAPELVRTLLQRVETLETALRDLIDAIPEETLKADPPLEAWVDMARAALAGEEPPHAE